MVNPEILLSTETDWVTCITVLKLKVRMEPFLLLIAKEPAFQEKKKNPLSSWDLYIVEAAWALYYPLDR